MAVARMRTSTSFTPGRGIGASRISTAPGPVMTPTCIVPAPVSAGRAASGAVTVDRVIPWHLAGSVGSPPRAAEGPMGNARICCNYSTVQGKASSMAARTDAPPRVVLLDWDNTLHDSAAVNFEALRRVLAGRGLQVTDDEYRRAYTTDYRELYRRLGLPDEQIRAASDHW